MFSSSAQAFLARLAKRRAEGTTSLRYALALGWYWSPTPTTFEQQATQAWNWFVGNASYGGLTSVAQVEGKPLLIQYGDPTSRDAWLARNASTTPFANRFTMRWAYGSTPTQDPGGRCPDATPKGGPTTWLPVEAEWGQFYGWGCVSSSLIQC
jgi:hypothetical protein